MKISQASAYRYIFHHYDDYQVCKSLCDELMPSHNPKQAVEISSASQRSIYGLYKEVSKSFPKWLDTYIPDREYDGNTSLHETYREEFSESEWKAIKLFEYHFNKFYNTPANASYETIVERKYSFFEMCKAMNEYGRETNKMGAKACRSNTLRKATSEAMNGVLIETEIKHRPEILEKCLATCIQDTFNISNHELMCLECMKSCSHEKGVHIYIVQIEEISTSDLITMLQAVLMREHNIVIQEIIFFKPGSLRYSKEGKPRRLYMRDELSKRTFGNEIVNVIQMNNESEEINQDLVLEDQYCLNCFGEFTNTLNRPLDLNHFDVFAEWKLEVPLPLQIFLERSFINKKTLQNETRSAYEEKIASLYCQVDALLNTLNMRYSGLTQDVNTDELLVNYHHISTVFNITSSCGISMSQRTGDRRLKEKADNELCYYKTYMRKYPLFYQITEESHADIHQVSMKDCHTILMIDNLVFLAQRSDPKPNETKLDQICTLPITLKGIPRNSNDLLQWHGPNCDMSSTCECMLREELLKDQIEDTFFVKTVAEKAAFSKFDREAVWGVGSLWSDIIDIFKLSSQPDIDQLDKTMESLTLDESIDMGDQYQEPNLDLNGQETSKQIIESNNQVLQQSKIMNIPVSSTEGVASPFNEEISDLDMRVSRHCNINLQTLNTCISTSADGSGGVVQEVKETGNPTEQLNLSDSYLNSSADNNVSNVGQFGIYHAYETILMENNEALQQDVNGTYQTCTRAFNQNDSHNVNEGNDLDEAQVATVKQHSFVSTLSNNEDTTLFDSDTTHSSVFEKSSMLESGFTPPSGGYMNYLLHDANSEDEEEFGTLMEEVVKESKIQRLSDFTSNVSNGSTTFRQFQPPKLLCRHPPPAAGRDDDINVLRNVLDDTIQKIEPDKNERILFAPDYKIARNLFKLMDQNPKYQIFLPEFPVLHLRKSKITNLISAYKSSGLIHIIQFMKDQELEKDWSKLIGIANIETATRNIWRLSVALHIAFMLKFVESLQIEEQCQLEKDLINDSVDTLDAHWRFQYEAFMRQGYDNNANFALHVDLMLHCDEIVAIAISERVGGPEGYNLLLASVKSSLSFSFLNGASSYGAFCIRLLYEHSICAPFHKRMKQTLYTQPHNNSSANFGLDTCREIDHRIAKKCVRHGSNSETILQKMCTVDEQASVHKIRQNMFGSQKIDDSAAQEEDLETVRQSSDRYLGKKVTSTDKLHIYRAVKLIQKQGAISTHQESSVRNVYHSLEPELSPCVLDKETSEIGKYLVLRHIANISLVKELESPSIDSVKGPKELLSRVKRAVSTTINRTKIKMQKHKTQAEKEEKSRKQKVVRLTKIVDCMSSKMNLCQAVVKPDCSKRSVDKSNGVKKALKSVLTRCYTAESQLKNLANSQIESSDEQTNLPPDSMEHFEKLMLLNFAEIPSYISTHTCLCVIEFAGAKFQNFAESGHQYIQYVKNGVLKKLFNRFPNLNHVVICEEKYQFTPDDLKFLTREKRKKADKVTITHLKDDNEIVSNEKFSKSSIVGTARGKQLVSTYLAQHIEDLQVNENVTIDIDSEFILSGCTCSLKGACNCCRFSRPIRALYSKDGGFQGKCVLETIFQTKGEAEMSQIDWLNELKENLKENDCVVNYVTSADIDTIVIHMFYVSLYWPRYEDGSFKNQVYVWLNKAKPELYNITGIVTMIENVTKKKFAAATVAVALCMGGNDFLPSYNGITHTAIVSAILGDQQMLDNLLNFSYSPSDRAVACSISESFYLDLLKRLYNPVYHSHLTLKEVRQLSMKLPNRSEFRHPQSWMPPENALKKLCQLTQCQVDYLMTAGDHSAALPDCVARGCLKKTEDGQVGFDLGDTTYTSDKRNELQIPEKQLSDKVKAVKEATQPRVKATRKRELVITPSKMSKSKRKLRMSTPRYVKS